MRNDSKLPDVPRTWDKGPNGTTEVDITRIDDPAFREQVPSISAPRSVTITVTEDRTGNHDVLIKAGAKEHFAFKVVTKGRQKMLDRFTLHMIEVAVAQLEEEDYAAK